MYVCQSAYPLEVILFTIFWLGWLFVFVSIKRYSFDVKSNDFCLLKIWIYELLLINIKQRSVQQSTISAHELLYEFLGILSIFRGNFYCFSLTTVAVDINVETLKVKCNSFVTFCSKCCRSSFFKKYNKLRLLTRQLI